MYEEEFFDWDHSQELSKLLVLIMYNMSICPNVEGVQSLGCEHEKTTLKFEVCPMDDVCKPWKQIAMIP